MRSSALVWVAVVACNSVEDAPVPIPEQAAVPVPEKAIAGVPHGGQITHVAVTERADAAVTVDNLGGLRLWPSLDGKREPVPFTINGADALAITHAGDELLVGVVDQAGAGQLVRFSRGGVQRGKIQLPGDVAIEQIAAIEGGMLVVRSDQTIERYDASGRSRGRIAADPSTSFGALAVRHGMAAVMIVAGDTSAPPAQPVKHKKTKLLPPVVVIERASALRWITLGEGLAWGATIEVPRNIDPHALAISPSHKRVLLTERTREVDLFDVGPTALTEVAGDGVITAQAGAIGLLDEDHAVAVAFGTVRWLIAKTATKKLDVDPWQIETSPTQEAVNDQVFATGDGMFVSALGPNLVKQDLHATTYLGWSDVAAGNVVISGVEVGLEPRNGRIVWLDRKLQREKDVDLLELGYGSPARAWWFDPDHAVLERSGKDNMTDVTLIDLRHHEVSVALGTYRYIQQVIYAEDVGMIAIVVAGEIHRFKVDLEYNKTSPLPTLTGNVQAQQLRLLDPARADGLIAIGVGYDDLGERVTTWRDADAPTILGTKGKTPLIGNPVGIDATGLIYVRLGDAVTGVRDGKDVLHFPAGETAEILVANVAGDRLAGIHGPELSVYDPNGGLKWRQNVWGAQAMVFTHDGARLVVRTTGGLLVLDAITGERLSAACGFTFGIMTKTPAATALNTRPVCEDLGT
ncbi:MAG: hypothetical protein ABI591_19430 [Kofleriaceae bacterium]